MYPLRILLYYLSAVSPSPSIGLLNSCSVTDQQVTTEVKQLPKLLITVIDMCMIVAWLPVIFRICLRIEWGNSNLASEMAEMWLVEGGYTEAHAAAARGHAAWLERCIAAGAKVDTQSELRETALIFACTSGSYECIKLLLLNGADAQHGSTDARLCEPLLHACTHASYDAIRLLLCFRGGAQDKPLGHDLNGSGPIEIAAVHQSDHRSVQLLAHFGARPSSFIQLDCCASDETRDVCDYHGFGNNTLAFHGLRVVRTHNRLLDQPMDRLKYCCTPVKRAVQTLLLCWHSGRCELARLDNGSFMFLLSKIPVQARAWPTPSASDDEFPLHLL